VQVPEGSRTQVIVPRDALLLFPAATTREPRRP
jgi:hypothetical protein